MTGHDADCRCLDCTHRRLGRITRAAGQLRSHLADLHSIGWEPGPPRDGRAGAVDEGEPATRDWTPRPGDARARRLLDQLATIAARADAELAGTENFMKTILDAHRPILAGGNRTLVSHTEFDQAEKNQARRRAAGQYTPTRLVDQPAHPGKKR